MQPRRPWFLLVVALASSCVGDGEVPSELSALPEEEARQHEAPDATGACSVDVQAADRWLTEIPIDEEYTALSLTAVEVGIDACGAAVIAWIGRESQDRTLSVQRLLPGGEPDWQQAFDGAIGDQDLLAIDVDDFGNALLLTGSRLRVLTAAGETPPYVPEHGYEFFQQEIVAGDRIVQEGVASLGTLARTEQGWLVATSVAGSGVWHLRLPSGDLDWTSSAPSQDGWAQPAPMLGVGEREVLRVERRIILETRSFVTVRRLTFGPEHLDGLHVLPTEETILDEQQDGFADAPLLVRSGERTIVGVTSFSGIEPSDLPPPEGPCRMARLFDVADPSSAPVLDFCGGLQGLVAHPDGSVLSLWAIGSTSDEQGRPLAATLLLLHTEPDGSERTRWDLTDLLGTVGHERYGAASLVLTPDASGVVVAGKSAERGLVTVARMPLAGDP